MILTPEDFKAFLFCPRAYKLGMRVSRVMTAFDWAIKETILKAFAEKSLFEELSMNRITRLWDKYWWGDNRDRQKEDKAIDGWQILRCFYEEWYTKDTGSGIVNYPLTRHTSDYSVGLTPDLILGKGNEVKAYSFRGPIEMRELTFSAEPMMLAYILQNTDFKPTEYIAVWPSGVRNKEKQLETLSVSMTPKYTKDSVRAIEGMARSIRDETFYPNLANCNNCKYILKCRRF